MIEVLAIVDSPNWAFARRAEAIRRYAPSDFRFSVIPYPLSALKWVPFGRYDLVWCLPPTKLPEVKEAMRRAGTDRPLIGCCNSGPGRHGHSLYEALAAADWTICNNHAVWAMGAEQSRSFNACCISNGVDLATFRNLVPIESRPARVLWTASEGKAHDVHDVKGYKVILQFLERLMPTRGIQTDFKVVPNDLVATEHEMVQFYNSGTVVVCASSSEGTPNILLEGAACGCVVVSSNVGNVPELVSHDYNGLVVYERLTPCFMDAIVYAHEHRERLSSGMAQDIPRWDWAVRAQWYYALFRRILQDGVGALRPFSWIDVPPEQI